MVRTILYPGNRLGSGPSKHGSVCSSAFLHCAASRRVEGREVKSLKKVGGYFWKLPGRQAVAIAQDQGSSSLNKESGAYSSGGALQTLLPPQ